MYFVYVLIYPLCAWILALLAAYFFPFPVPEVREEVDGFVFFVYQSVDYVLALFMLFFCFTLLQRICRRSVAFLLQLPLPLKDWLRYKHIIPVILSVTVLVYLFQHMLIHTLIGLGIVALSEWFSRETTRYVHIANEESD